MLLLKEINVYATDGLFLPPFDSLFVKTKFVVKVIHLQWSGQEYLTAHTSLLINLIALVNC